MADIAWQQPGAADLAMGPSDGIGTELYTRRGSQVRAPEPNPNFSFPRIPPPPAADDTPTEPSTRHRRIRPQNLAILPGPPSPNLPQGSPVKFEAPINSSPGKGRPMSRGMGHRREGSQFIGGDGTKTGPGLMSSSPTKGVEVVPSPPVSAGRRRGHAHRRSGAMSTNDFSAFLNSSVASAPPVPGSAPTTPLAFTHPVPPHAHLERAQSQPSMTTREKIEVANAAGEQEDRELASTPRSATSRPRVGFSEKIEFIPRPLSTISAETVSSVSTVRPSHSMNGSISSILDQRPPTPVSAGVAQSSDSDSRPTTSDSQEEQQPFFGMPEDVRSSPKRPRSASGKALFAKRRGSPPPKLPVNDLSPSSIDETNYFARTSSDQISPKTLIPPGNAMSTGSDSPEIGDRKREARGRSLAARLLGKPRHKLREEERESSPTDTPFDANVPAGLVSLDDVGFDEDTTCVIHSAGYSEPVPAPYRPSPSPRRESFDKDDKAALDLDLTYDSVKIDENSPASFANVMRSGMPQHRRTESAPSLSPVQRQSFMPSKGVSPQKMADVFEEDEEHDSPPRAPRQKAQSFSQPKRRADLQGLGVQIVDAEVGEIAQPRRKSRSPSSKADTAPSESAPSLSDAMSSATEHEGLPDLAVEIANLSEEPRFSMVTKSSDEDTITPTGSEKSPRIAQDHKTLPIEMPTWPPGQLDFAPPPSLAAPHTPHDSSDLSTSSIAPSPSFDGPRLNTAASSITDRTTWSSSHAQSSSTCPDSAQSMEDVPSLTSSLSGMSGQQPSHAPHHSVATGSPTKGNGQGYHAHTFSGLPSPAFLNRPQSTGADRSFSLGGGLSPRQSRPRNPFGSRPNTSNGAKRASLASLSRLMSKGGDGERSKLSISWGAQDVQPEEAKKESRGKRLSRVLRFWKSKEKLRDTAAATAEED